MRCKPEACYQVAGLAQAIRGSREAGRNALTPRSTKQAMCSLLRIAFPVNDFTPLYFIPDSFMEKIADRGVDVANNHKAESDPDFTRKQVNGGEIQKQNNKPVADGFYDSSLQRFFSMVPVRMQLFYHGSE